MADLVGLGRVVFAAPLWPRKAAGQRRAGRRSSSASADSDLRPDDGSSRTALKGFSKNPCQFGES
jgi:2,4-dienoyl-CoA reductase-like NADH-dependent reductase (Old Yellow Enzyme family)